MIRFSILNSWLRPASFLLAALLTGYLSVATAAPKNFKPSPNAGPDQQVPTGSRVNLNGAQSFDLDGRVMKYQWTQTLGPKVKLLTPKSAVASFISPTKLKKPAQTAKLVFRLTVQDDKKARASDTVAITVSPPPICILPEVLQDNRCLLPPPSCTAPKVLQNNVCVLVCQPGQRIQNDRCVTPDPVCADTEVLQEGVCRVPPVACIKPKVRQYDRCILPDSLDKLNDTGITFCSDGSEGMGSHAGCGNGRYPGQDGEFGRDVYLNDDQDGHAGFSFTKLDNAGAALPATAAQWACIKDNVTGLVWENKTADHGLHDKALGYSYYRPDFNPENRYGSATDVAGFIEAVNQEGLCGARDWRLPTVSELLGIVDFSRPLPGPAIDLNYFPHSRVDTKGIYPFNSHYWTASPYPKDAAKAWAVLFADGSVYDDDRNRPGGAGVRLVRGGTVQSPSERFGISGDGQEVTDHETGLIWRRCVEGMHWDGRTCTGQFKGFMFEEALQHALSEALQTGKNWRMPNPKELVSLLQPDYAELMIDPQIFPATPNFQTWTATAYSQDGFFSWMVHFFYGWSYFSYTEDTGAARLVRDADR